MKRLPILLAATVVACSALALAQNATQIAPHPRARHWRQALVARRFCSSSSRTLRPLSNLTAAATTGPVQSRTDAPGHSGQRRHPRRAGPREHYSRDAGRNDHRPWDCPADPAEAKPKGPTIIDAQEATFDQRANIAVFVGTGRGQRSGIQRLVRQNDGLFWKHEDKGKPVNGKATPTPVTPKPATPKAVTPTTSADGKATPAKLPEAVAWIMPSRCAPRRAIASKSPRTKWTRILAELNMGSAFPTGRLTTRIPETW